MVPSCFVVHSRMHLFGCGMTFCLNSKSKQPALLLKEHTQSCRGQRVIYTTPLKALSNQKLFEMRERFGTERVGLSTGDASVQTDSPIMIMTTEILRNMMYRTEEDDATINKDTLADVGLIVLDEVKLMAALICCIHSVYCTSRCAH